jgi:putative transcriptional regulator
MDTSQILTNHFLIAMPGLQDPNFSRTLTYVCEHSQEGTMGIVVNRPMGLQLGEMLEQLDIQATDLVATQMPIFLGGPVQPDRGFVLHNGSHLWDSTLQIVPGVNVTTSKDILEAIARGEGPDHVLVALGYAGWSGGQLEDEMSSNAWLSGPATGDILFRMPAEQRWHAAARLLGVDLDLMSADVGHA